MAISFHEGEKVQFVGQNDEFTVVGEDPQKPGVVIIEWVDKNKKQWQVSVPDETLEDFDENYLPGISMG